MKTTNETKSLENELIKAQEDYIVFLTEEYRKIFTVAYINHYQVSNKSIDAGEKKRKVINNLREKLELETITKKLSEKTN